MIEIVYSAPCTWNPRVRGFAEATIGYFGEDPVKTAYDYVKRIDPTARLHTVVKDGHIWLG